MAMVLTPVSFIANNPCCNSPLVVTPLKEAFRASSSSGVSGLNTFRGGAVGIADSWVGVVLGGCCLQAVNRNRVLIKRKRNIIFIVYEFIGWSNLNIQLLFSRKMHFLDETVLWLSRASFLVIELLCSVARAAKRMAIRTKQRGKPMS